MAESRILVIFVNEDLFEHTELRLSDTFTFLGSGTASLDIRLHMVPEGAEAFASRFLDSFVGSMGATVGSEEHIGRSPVRGVPISGSRDGQTYEAWIHTYPGVGNDVWGVSFLMQYQNDIQRVALYELLDSVNMIQG
jgi:hypothetical protein